MTKAQAPQARMKTLLETLSGPDGVARQKARKNLVTLGTAAVPSLLDLLGNYKAVQARWEAAKALGSIDDARSIPALVRALEDDDPDVAWLAAVALRRYKKAAWPPLLRLLLSRVLVAEGVDSTAIRRGAHHILLHQEAKGFRDLLQPLLEALEPGAGRGSAAVSAFEVLRKLKVSP